MKSPIGTILFLAAAAIALALSACGSEAQASRTDGAEASSSDVSTETSTETSTEPPTEPPTELPTEVAADVSTEPDDVEPVHGAAGEAVDAQGSTTSIDTGCHLGLPFEAGEGDCEAYGGYRLQPLTYTAEFRGTLSGTYTQHATFAVDDAGAFVFASVDTFVGTLGECGEGTVSWNSVGWGDFELTDPPGLFATSRNVNWISYTATESELGTLDVVLSARTRQTALRGVEMTGTLSCGDGESTAGLVAAARPESSVETAEAFDWTGTSVFAVGDTCVARDDRETPDICPTSDGFFVQRLRNDLVFSGSFEGEARFFAANLIGNADFEHSGIMIFDGVIEGCGEGVVLFVNEATGNAFESDFSHLRAFTPQDIEPGPTGVRLDVTVKQIGVVSAEFGGSYSC